MIKSFIFFNLFISICSMCYGQTGETWTPSSNDLSAAGPDASFPQIAIDSTGRAIVVFGISNGTNVIIQAAYSTDGGASWTTSSNDLSAAGQSAILPQIAIDSTGRAIAVWRRYNGSNYIIQAAYSADGGVSWTASSSDLSAVGQDAHYPQIAIDSTGRAIAIWQRFNGSSYIIQAAYSTNGGVSWTASSNDLSAVGQSAILPQIAIDSTGRAIAVWQRSNGTNTIIQAAYSTNGGVSWTASSNDLSAVGQNATASQIAIDSTGRAIVVWVRFNGSDYIIQAAYSTNGGVSWTASSNDLSATGQDATAPQIAIDSTGRAIAIWSRSNGSNYIVQAAYSTDGGVSWTASSNDLSAVGQDATNSKIAIYSTGRAIVVWKRSDGTNDIIQAAYSTDGGVSWAASSNDLSAPGQDAFEADIAISGTGRAIAVWFSFDGINAIVKAAYSGTLSQGYGSRSVVNCFLQKDVVDYIYWDAVSAAVSYRVYGDSSLQDLLYEGVVNGFYNHGRKKGSTNYYYITYITSEGSEFELSTVTIN